MATASSDQSPTSYTGTKNTIVRLEKFVWITFHIRSIFLKITWQEILMSTLRAREQMGNGEMI